MSLPNFELVRVHESISTDGTTIKESNEQLVAQNVEAKGSNSLFLYFECTKCRKTLRIDDIFEVERCGHQICRSCTRRFLFDWSTLLCPLTEDGSCNSEITLDEAGLVLDENELTALFFPNETPGREEETPKQEENLLSIATGGDYSTNVKCDDPDQLFFCDLCDALASFGDLFQVGSDCQHILCRPCASTYVNDPENAPNYKRLRCPVLGCPAVIDQFNASTVITDPDAVATFECEICTVNTGPSDLFRFASSCGHKICRDCARNYLKTLISDRKPLKCPIFECNEFFSFSDAELVLDGEDAKNLQEMLLEISVSDCIHCPKPNCPGFAEVVPPRKKFVCPVCSYDMCIQCGRDWHASVSCDVYGAWLTQSGDERLADYAMTNRLQICPNCRNGVERTRGCDHMHCRCGTHFCYKCGETGPLVGGRLQHPCKDSL